MRAIASALTAIVRSPLRLWEARRSGRLTWWANPAYLPSHANLEAHDTSYAPWYDDPNDFALGS